MNTDTNIDGVETDFISIYAEGILEDLGIKIDGREEVQKLVAMIKNRINARVYLEMVAMLTPEQAALVMEDMDKENPDPEAVIQKTLAQLPDFAPRLAAALGKIRSELLADLKPLVS
jgi:hypothetical protein